MLHVNLQNNPTKKKHYVAFMNLIECDAMEIALPLDTNQECLYLPLFGVYNPKKPVKSVQSLILHFCADAIAQFV